MSDTMTQSPDMWQYPVGPQEFTAPTLDSVGEVSAVSPFGSTETAQLVQPFDPIKPEQVEQYYTREGQLIPTEHSQAVLDAARQEVQHVIEPQYTAPAAVEVQTAPEGTALDRAKMYGPYVEQLRDRALVVQEPNYN